VRLIGQPEFRVVFVRRRNILRAVVSVLIAEQTQLWHRWDTEREIESYYGELEPLDVTDVRTRVRDLAEELQQLETVIERSTDRALRALWSFLGVEAISSDRIDFFLRPERSKLNSPETYRLLPNADEIERKCGSDVTGHLF